jgi:hypothetical protein
MAQAFPVIRAYDFGAPSPTLLAYDVLHAAQLPRDRLSGTRNVPPFKTFRYDGLP